MDLKKVASYLRDASSEIKTLKEENLELREKIAKLEKTASIDSNIDNDFIGFGEVDNNPMIDMSNHPVEQLKAYFQ